MKANHRKTAITKVDEGQILLRGYDIAEIAGRISWGSAVYLTLTGELPEDSVGRIMDAILVSVIDHGPTPVSTSATCIVASAGASLSASVAAGILGIAQHHGGAIEDCMTVLEECIGLNLSAAEAAASIAQRYQERKKRIPGFGHRQHATDPRTTRLFELATAEGFAGKYVNQARELESVLSKAKSKPVPINADGAIAALLCEIGFPKKAANGIFMIARVPGLIAHSIEEQSRNAPLLSLDSESYEYDGPAEREIPHSTPQRKKKQ